MASIATSLNGTRRVVWTIGSRQLVVRLGRVDAKSAAGVKLHLERLIVAAANHTPPPVDTAAWLNRVSDVLNDRIARAGLCEPRGDSDVGTVGGAFDAFTASRREYVKAGTAATWAQCRKHLCGFLGDGRKLVMVRPADADDFRRHVRGDYSEAYTAKMTMIAKAVFRYALRRKVIDASPFADVKNGSQRNPDRQAFIDRPTIQKVIDAAPDARWRLIIALARFGGLRCPSELAALSWADVNWAELRVTIRSAKTEHHAGHATRVMPIFPELLPFLREAFEVAEPGAVNVVAVPRSGAANLRTQMERIMTRAGVAPWPKLFQNLRASRATELRDAFPSHVAAAWLGHAEGIADRHYRQVTDAHFAKAVKDAPPTAVFSGGEKASQNASQYPAATERSGSQADPNGGRKTLVLQKAATGCDPVQTTGMGDEGCERSAVSRPFTAHPVCKRCRFRCTGDGSPRSCYRVVRPTSPNCIRHYAENPIPGLNRA